MESIVTKLVNELKVVDLISPEKEDNYLYAIEVIIMKFLGFLVVATIGIVTKKYIETIVFYISFSELRAYTNGYHSKNYVICLIESAIVYTIICDIASYILSNFFYYSHILTVVSIMLIYILSPVNSDEIMLDEQEIQYHKEIIKYILLIYLVILGIFINFQIKFEIVVFFELAIIFDMALVVIGKYVNFKKGEEE